MASTKRKTTGERRLEIVQAARDILISERKQVSSA
jgi:hypothetical protein